MSAPSIKESSRRGPTPEIIGAHEGSAGAHVRGDRGRGEAPRQARQPRGLVGGPARRRLHHLPHVPRPPRAAPRPASRPAGRDDRARGRNRRSSTARPRGPRSPGRSTRPPGRRRAFGSRSPRRGSSWRSSRSSLCLAPPTKRARPASRSTLRRANPHAKDTRFIATAGAVYRRMPGRGRGRPARRRTEPSSRACRATSSRSETAPCAPRRSACCSA